MRKQLATQLGLIPLPRFEIERWKDLSSGPIWVRIISISVAIEVVWFGFLVYLFTAAPWTLLLCAGGMAALAFVELETVRLGYVRSMLTERSKILHRHGHGDVNPSDVGIASAVRRSLFAFTIVRSD